MLSLLSLLPLIQDLPADTTDAGTATPYDTLWSDSAAAPSTGGIESIMLAQDKLYVVLAVVLIIWLGIAFYLYRTDRKLNRLERSAASGISKEHGEETS